MLKRMFCVILTLILLVSYVPVTALTAEAADYTVTEGAITVLKQLQPFQYTCNDRGYIGYNTKCTYSATCSDASCTTTGVHTHPHGSGKHVINEKTADTALRTALNNTVKAVNNFVGSYGLAMSQSKFDALVIFSYLNGNAWMSGSTGFKRAVTKGLIGTDLLDAICSWDASIADDDKCMVIANMYLYGVYSSAAPSYFVRVTLNGGTYKSKNGVFTTYNNQQTIGKYYDLKHSDNINVVPTLKISDTQSATFLGYTDTNNVRLTKVTSAHHGQTLTAQWTNYDDVTGYSFSITTGGNYYLHSSADDTKIQNHYVTGKLEFDGDHIDINGYRWGHLAKAEYFYMHNGTGYDAVRKDYVFTNSKWVKLGEYNGPSENNSGSGVKMDLTVTVTNAYVNSRASNSIHSAKRGVYYQGAKLRIIDAKEGSGFLWGQVAKSATDNTPICWVALMYTNYDDVRSSNSGSVENNTTVVARAKVDVAGYVNVRSDAGTDAPIVGSLTDGTFADIYELKYVNGVRWGRTKLGWFCLSYAEVSYLSADTGESSGTGFTAYSFSGTLKSLTGICNTYGDMTDVVDFSKLKEEEKPKVGDSVVVTNLTKASNGDIWGKIKWGWVRIMTKTNADPYYQKDNATVELGEIKFFVAAENATVRTSYSTSSDRILNLSKGTEINVELLTIDDTTVWGYITKNIPGQYAVNGGWVNLASKYFSRNSAPDLSINSGEVMYATVTGAAEVNVRKSDSTTAGKVGVVREGMTYLVLEGPSDKGWYKLDVDVDSNPSTDSWVYGGYLKIEKKAAASAGGSNGGSTVGGKVQTGTGVVANTYSGVNVRTGPGTGYALKGKILPGTAVEIRAVKQVGAALWGKILLNGEERWVCMDYIAMIDYKEFPNESTGSGAGTGSNAGGSTVTGAVAAVYEGTVAAQKTGDAYDNTYYGSTVEVEAGMKVTIRGWDKEASAGNGKLVVFSEPDIGSNAVRFLNTGDAITLYEILTVEEERASGSGTDNLNTGSATMKVSTIWARVNDGYIKAPGDNLNLNILDEAIYTLVNHDSLYVYKDNSGVLTFDKQYVTTTDGESSTTAPLTIKKGDQVRITKAAINGTSIYGRVELIYTLTEQGMVDSHYTGWVELTKMSKGAVAVQTQTPSTPDNSTNNNSGSEDPLEHVGSTGDTGSNVGFVPVAGSAAKYIGTVVNVNDPVNNPLKARSLPDTGSTIQKTYKNGDTVNIYETVLSGNMAWGRTDAGWVYLWYVRMRPASGMAVDVNIIRNPNTTIYKESSGTDAEGTYVQQAVVEVMEQGETRVRTKLGWVNKTDLLHG